MSTVVTTAKRYEVSLDLPEQYSLAQVTDALVARLDEVYVKDDVATPTNVAVARTPGPTKEGLTRYTVTIDLDDEEDFGLAQVTDALVARLDEVYVSDAGVTECEWPANVTVAYVADVTVIVTATDLRQVFGYRTNEDGTETLAYEVGGDGLVSCVHDAPNCCAGCVEADHRLYRNRYGAVITAR